MSTVSALYVKHGEVCFDHNLYLSEKVIEISIARYYYTSEDIVTPEALKIFETALVAYVIRTKKFIKIKSLEAIDYGSYMQWRARIAVFPNLYIYRKEVVDMPEGKTMLEIINYLVPKHMIEYPNDD